MSITERPASGMTEGWLTKAAAFDVGECLARAFDLHVVEEDKVRDDALQRRRLERLKLDLGTDGVKPTTLVAEADLVTIPGNKNQNKSQARNGLASRVLGLSADLQQQSWRESKRTGSGRWQE